MRSSPGLRVRDSSVLDRLSALVPRITPGAMASDRTLAVHPGLTSLFPDGLARGSTVLCHGSAATSLAILVSAGAVGGGAWMGVAGLPTLGVQACREAGVPVERIVLVREPLHSTFDDTLWGQVLATLVDGFEIVVFGAASRVRAGTARRLQARLQARGAVFVVVGDAGPFSGDLRLTGEVEWRGLGAGHGHLRARQVHLTLDGRRLQRPRRDTLWYPSHTGAIEPSQVAVVPAGPAAGPAVDPAAGPAVDPAPLRRTG